MINVCDILYNILENKNVYDKDFDLIESGLLDSFVFIQLFAKLEDKGITIHPTRINRELLRTPGSIQKLIDAVSSHN